jgi:hypothetical protein
MFTLYYSLKMNQTDKVEAANKRRRDAYVKSKAYEKVLRTTRTSMGAKEKARVCKARSRAKKKKNDRANL